MGIEYERQKDLFMASLAYYLAGELTLARERMEIALDKAKKRFKPRAERITATLELNTPFPAATCRRASARGLLESNGWSPAHFTRRASGPFHPKFSRTFPVRSLARSLFDILMCAAFCSFPLPLQISGAEDVQAHGSNALDFTIKLETVLQHDDGKFLWYHPRAATIPARDAASVPTVILTLQKHLNVSDYYSGLWFMRRAGLDGAWDGPHAPPELDWVREMNGVTVSVADVTPGWHAPSGKLLAIGCRVRYSPKGVQIEDQPLAHQTVYAAYDPAAQTWTRWQALEMPEDPKFNFTRNACSQWLVEKDGTLLVPVYFGPDADKPYSTTVVRCRFDGGNLTYLRHGDELALNVARGLYEPSLVRFGSKYFLTLRNDVKDYVASSEDGLHFTPPRPWTFDDGADLGSYNTQQHWLSHSDGLFLVYTRSGAGNDHITRHRAPLFIARVDPGRLCVIRATERVVIPERGGELGNFGASAMSPTESWVTVSEGIWDESARRRGAKGVTWLGRVVWSKPNRDFTASQLERPAAQ